MKVLQFKREQAETEGARRATAGSACSERSENPDPEVPEKARRRRFTAEYKIRILREADACRGDGDIGALLRREGLYSSNLAAWRRQRDAIAQEGLKARKRGRKAKQVDPRIKELERENARLKRRLKKTEIILDFQKKASELLGISLENPDSEENN
jgi:transposase-like protein